MDRPDIQFAVKKLATAMCKPTNRNWQELQRLGRYLQGRPRLVINYNWQEPTLKLTANSDSDWAGDKIKRKSTSGGIIRIGGHSIKSWSKNQSVIALSSAESLTIFSSSTSASNTFGESFHDCPIFAKA